MFPHANQVLIEGSYLAVHNSYNGGTNREGFKALQKATAPAAFHNSGERPDPPKCHPRTREAILKKILSWVKGEIDAETFVFWLNGTVGVGKSAIAQTIAEMCEKEGLLLASFFFARSDATRNNAKLLITTLAYQIALAIPPVRSYIEQVFEHDPLIDTRCLETQAVRLLVEPLEHAIADQVYIPPLIVIDGLDECHDTSEQCKVLDVLSHVGGAVNVTSRRLVFLIASRPEQEISLKFKSRTLEDVSSQYTVNTCPDSDDDIHRFLEDGFNEIKNTHPLKSSIPAPWPTPADLRDLVWKAGGQFLYATLVISYTSSIRHRPTDRLAVILHDGAAANDNPFAALDTLYHQVFSTRENVQSLLTILGLQMTNGVRVDGTIRDVVRQRLSMEFEDVKLLFGDLVSVVDVAEGPSGWQYLIFQHASLRDFLTNESRSREYYIQTSFYHTEWVIWGLEQNGQLTDKGGVINFHCHLSECHPSPRLQAALQIRDICSLFGRHVWDVPSLRLIYDMIWLIGRMPFENADKLYQFQSGALKRHIISLFEGINARPLTTFTVTLLLSTFSLKQAAYFGNGSTMHALKCIFGFSIGPFDGPVLNGEFYSFLSAMLHGSDRSTPLQYAVNTVRIAAAPVLLHYLSQPPELRHTPPFKRFLEKLKSRPWMSRTRSSLHKKKKHGTWYKFYKCCFRCSGYRDRPKCVHNNPDHMFWAAAHISPTPPRVLFLRESPPLLAYFYALVLLHEMLAEVPRSEELITCCKNHVFHWACILFPRQTKVARAAISKYLGRMEAEERRWEELWLD